MVDAPVRPTLLRLFLAVWPEAAVRAAIVAWQHDWRWPPGAAVVAPERLHLTLHFLGDVATAQVPALTAALRVEVEAFELRFGHAAIWRGGIAVLRPERTPPALLALQARLAAALATLPLSVDPRPYRPHVTLARRAMGATAPPVEPKFDWRADAGFVLVRSLPGGGYEVLERFS